MSDIFTKENLVTSSIEKVFKNNCIRHIRTRADWPLAPEESIFDIRGKQVTITYAHKIQSDVRLNFVLSLVRNVVDKYELDLNCRFVLTTQDSPMRNEKYTRVCFSAPLDSNHIQIPDPHIFYHIQNLSNNLAGEKTFDEKENIVSFFGSDSGELYPDLLNQRVKFCHKANENPNVLAKITNFVHFRKEMLEDLGIQKSAIEGAYTTIPAQLGAKFILDIDGNAPSWDRTAWGMASNSYLIHLKSELCNSLNWYGSFIKENGIMPIYSEEDILSFKIKYNKEIKEKQKAFSSILLRTDTHTDYLALALFRYNDIYHS